VSPGDTIEEGGDTDVLSPGAIETGASTPLGASGFAEEPSTVTGQDRPSDRISLKDTIALDHTVDAHSATDSPSWVPEAPGEKFEDTLENDDDSGIDQEALRGIFRDLEQRQARPRVLIVDDEPYVLRAIRRLLRPMDVEVLTASNGTQAIEVLDEAPVSVLISDQFMPGMSGTELLEHAQKGSPETVRVMLTGNNDLATAVEAINRGDVFRFVNKPWKNEELIRIVELGLEQNRYVVGHRMYRQMIQRQNEHLSLINDELERAVDERTKQLQRSKHKVQELYRDLQKSFDATLRVMMSVMELGDIQIVDHCQRTAHRVQSMAKYINLDDKITAPLMRAALLHWLGLINAPATLFTKTEADFDFEEQAAWEFHCLLGQQALDRVPALRRSALIILNYLKPHDSETFKTGSVIDGMADPVDDVLVFSCQLLQVCSTFERERTRLWKLGERNDREFIEAGLRAVEQGRGTTFNPKLADKFTEMITKSHLKQRVELRFDSVSDLAAGMTLSRPLETKQGLPVAPREMVLTDELLGRLKLFERTGGISSIYVWG